MHLIERFLQEIDDVWSPAGSGRLRLCVLGSTALFLQTDYTRGTKDSDVLETDEIRGDVRERLITLAGRDTAMHQRHRMYFDIVGRGFPFLPADPLWHPLEGLSTSLRHFDVAALDITDVVVSKLARFHGDDRGDIAAMVERGLVPHAFLIERFLSAVERFQLDARSNRLPIFIKNLHRVERDDFGVEGTDIDLPSWIGE